MQPPLQCFRDIPAASRLSLAFGAFGMTSTGSTSTDFTSRPTCPEIRSDCDIMANLRQRTETDDPELLAQVFRTAVSKARELRWIV